MLPFACKGKMHLIVILPAVQAHYRDQKCRKPAAQFAASQAGESVSIDHRLRPIKNLVVTLDFFIVLSSFPITLNPRDWRGQPGARRLVGGMSTFPFCFRFIQPDQLNCAALG